MEPLDLSKSQFFEGITEFKPLDPAGIKPAPLVERSLAPQMEVLSLESSKVDTTPDFSTKPSAQINEEKVSREWYVDDVVKRLALNGSFTIYYFIGAIQGEPVDYIMSPSFAGSHHIFTSSRELCDNCGRSEQQAQQVTGTTPITSMLLDYVEIGELASMRPVHVEPFLIKNLKWRVVTGEGQRYNPRELSDFDLNLTCKVAPLPGQQGEVVYEAYPQVIAEIIRTAS